MRMPAECERDPPPSTFEPLAPRALGMTGRVVTAEAPGDAGEEAMPPWQDRSAAPPSTPRGGGAMRGIEARGSNGM